MRDSGFDLPVAVNLSPRDLLNIDLPEQIAEILRTEGVDPWQLNVEITEQAMVVDFETSVSVCHRRSGRRPSFG